VEYHIIDSLHNTELQKQNNDPVLTVLPWSSSHQKRTKHYHTQNLINSALASTAGSDMDDGKITAKKKWVEHVLTNALERYLIVSTHTNRHTLSAQSVDQGRRQLRASITMPTQQSHEEGMLIQTNKGQKQSRGTIHRKWI